MAKKQLNEQLLSIAWKGSKAREIITAPIAEKYNLTQNELDVLAFLYSFNNIDTAKEIAKYRVISKSLISKSVKDLLSRGYLDSVQDQEDKRVLHLSLTEKSLHIAEEVSQMHIDFFKHAYSHVTAEEYKVINDVMTKVSKSLDDYLKEHS